MALDVDLNLPPIALVVTDLLAAGADGQQTAQGLDLGQGVFQFGDQELRASSACLRPSMSLSTTRHTGEALLSFFWFTVTSSRAQKWLPSLVQHP